MQSTKDANKFYEGKVEELGGNLKALEKILQEKTDGLRLIEDGKYQYLWGDARHLVILCYSSLKAKGP